MARSHKITLNRMSDERSARTQPSDASGVVIFPPAIYLGGLVVGYLIQWLLPVWIVPAAWSVAIRIIGVVVLAIGAWLMVSALGVFHRVGTAVSPFEPTTNLASDGPYRFSRNPIYLGMTLLLAGFAFLGNALWPLIAVVPAVGIIQTQVIAREETYLEAKFGNDYRDFKRRVRRWF